MNTVEPWREQLRRFRSENALSQQEIADFLGVAQKSISRWELGAASPEGAMLDGIRLMVGARQDSVSSILNAVRAAHVPLALVDGAGTVLAASAAYCAHNPRSDALASSPEVLVVDADEGRRRILRAVLGGWGLVPFCLSSGRDALAQVAAGYRARTVIVAATLPGEWNGADTARALQSVVGTLPVVLLGMAAGDTPMTDVTRLPLPLSLPRLRVLLESWMPGSLS